MKKAAFIDHSFKKKSGSSEFFTDILAENYTTDVYWDDSWLKKPGVRLSEIEKKNYDLVVFFQVLNASKRSLLKHKIKNAVFVPMYDSAYSVKDEHWKKLSPFKFINFSKTLHDKLVRLNLNSLNVQYFCPPDANPDFSTNHKLNGFFWQRYDRVNWNHISAIIKHAPFKKIHIHKAIDPPGYDFYPPTEEELGQYNITISEWFQKREDYLQIMNSTDVFFVPRKFEGIGMSFIEAMSMGKCVVAPNFPTMNEYITHGYNGLLYDLEKIPPLDFSQVEEISRNAYETVKKGYEKWNQDKVRILEFCDAPTRYWNGNGSKPVPTLLNRMGYEIQRLRRHINKKHPRIARALFRIKVALGLNF